MSHTPGPWKAYHQKKTKYCLENYEIHYSDDGECVAEIVHEKDDALLIAAAPDLLEALASILENYTHNKGKGLGNGTIHKAKKAIAKATGDAE
jgi:hypothetical protein